MPLKIELKKIQVLAKASEETDCYTAEIWVDGRKFCDVSNGGTGGPDNHHGCTREQLAELNRRIAAEYPAEPYTTGSGDMMVSLMLEQDIEIVCGDLLNKHLVTKDLKRKLRTKTLFTKAGETKPMWETKLAADLVAAKNPGATVLNLMPFDDALKLYMANA